MDIRIGQNLQDWQGHNGHNLINMRIIIPCVFCVLFVSVNDDDFIHWVTAYTSHIFSFIVRWFALYYTKLRLAGWLLQVPHPPHSCIYIWACISWVWSLRLVCELDVCFDFQRSYMIVHLNMYMQSDKIYCMMICLIICLICCLKRTLPQQYQRYMNMNKRRRALQLVV